MRREQGRANINTLTRLVELPLDLLIMAAEHVDGMEGEAFRTAYLIQHLTGVNQLCMQGEETRERRLHVPYQQKSKQYLYGRGRGLAEDGARDAGNHRRADLRTSHTQTKTKRHMAQTDERVGIHANKEREKQQHLDHGGEVPHEDGRVDASSDEDRAVW